MSLPYAKTCRVAAVLLLIAGISCGDTEDTTKPTPTYASGEEQLIAEFGGQQVDPMAVERVLAISKELTLEARSAGILKVVAALKQKLAAKRIDGSVLDEIEDFTIGQPLAGVGEYYDGPGKGTTTTAQALRTPNVNEEYFDCPPRVENELINPDESCVEIVSAISEQVKRSLQADDMRELAQDMIDGDALLNAQSEEFKDFAVEYLQDLSVDIHQFGADVAALRAEYILRAEELCDNVILEKEEIARLRGITESETIIRELIGARDLQLAPEGGECLQIGPTGKATEALIKAKVEQYVEEHPMECLDYNRDNPVVVDAEKARLEGIWRGVEAHTTTIWIGVFRNGNPWGDNEQYTVAVIDGCEPKDQIKYTTSPLVVDLDNDGLELTTNAVPFDLLANGQPQKVTWAGEREGFLALDLNGDGRITSGRELFGNRSLCQGARCADGAAALALYDRPSEGGNGDGRIDAEDEVFASLKIWVDRNQNGRSEADELSSLSDHGITAFSLQVTPMDQQVPGGHLTLSLAVETAQGSLTAYDVWFDNLVSPGFKKPLF